MELTIGLGGLTLGILVGFWFGYRTGYYACFYYINGLFAEFLKAQVWTTRAEFQATFTAFNEWFNTRAKSVKKGDNL